MGYIIAIQDASKISLDQFNNYVNRINNINKLNYVFNSAKLSEDAARAGIRTFFLKSGNAEAIWNANPSLFTNLILPNGLQVTNLNRFKQFLTDTNATHSFYDFVKTF